MSIAISFLAQALPKTGALAVPVAAGRKLLATAEALDKTSGGAIGRAVKASRFKGEKDQILEILAPSELANSRLLLYGVGDRKKLSASDMEGIGAAILAQLAGSGETQAAVAMDGLSLAKGTAAEAAAALALGARLRSYRFDKYRTKEKPDAKPSLKKLRIALADGKSLRAAQHALKTSEEIAAGVFLTRDLVSEPANVINPKSFVAEARRLTKLGLKLRVLGRSEMHKLGMGALLGVAQGSVNEPQLLILEWLGAPKSKKEKGPLAFVGKGVTFDTGGISIKPAGGMEDMKWDMGGAGVVVGLMRALAGRKAKVDAIGICGLVENMPDGNAQRPGDIVTSMSGQTIEVINTDAEGRLVLADALWYVQEKYKPRAIVDLATLTGAIIVSLGHEHAGLFSNDDKLSEQLSAAGSEVSELVWRLPLGSAYDKLIDSEAADMKNVGNRSAGSITAAQFLQRFIKDGTPWAHLDIAGVTWSSKNRSTSPKGATAFGVRLLDRWVASYHER